MKSTAAPQKEGPRINREIRAREVQLIDSEGKNHGVIQLPDALSIAEAAGSISSRSPPIPRPAGLQNSRLRAFPLRRAEEGRRGAQETESRRGQGDQASARHRRPRLRREDERGAPLLRRGRQGQGHAALPRPRNRASGHRLSASHRVKAETATLAKVELEPSHGRPADGDGAGAAIARVSPQGQGRAAAEGWRSLCLNLGFAL